MVDIKKLKKADLLVLTQDLIDFVVDMADLDDVYANEHLERTRSYAAFDEPGAVYQARKMLKKLS